MKDLRIGCGTCVAILLVSSLAAGIVIWRLTSGPDIQYVKRLLDGANLRGKTPAQLIRFIDADDRLSHAPYSVELVNGKKYGVIRADYLGARTDFSNQWPYRVDIVIVFYFSSNNRLSHYDVSERLTSM